MTKEEKETLDKIYYIEKFNDTEYLSDSNRTVICEILNNVLQREYNIINWKITDIHKVVIDVPIVDIVATNITIKDYLKLRYGDVNYCWNKPMTIEILKVYE